jgi:hypothetical protein
MNIGLVSTVGCCFLADKTLQEKKNLKTLPAKALAGAGQFAEVFKAMTAKALAGDLAGAGQLAEGRWPVIGWPESDSTIKKKSWMKNPKSDFLTRILMSIGVFSLLEQRYMMMMMIMIMMMMMIFT